MLVLTGHHKRNNASSTTALLKCYSHNIIVIVFIILVVVVTTITATTTTTTTTSQQRIVTAKGYTFLPLQQQQQQSHNAFLFVRPKQLQRILTNTQQQTSSSFLDLILGIQGGGDNDTSSSSSSSSSDNNMKVEVIDDTATDDSNIENNKIINEEKCNERANFVKYVLYHRLQYVKYGKRMKDFAKWVKDNKGNTNTIISLHGTENNGSSIDFESLPFFNKPINIQDENIVLQQLQNDPFSKERMNLDIVITSQTPENCYIGKEHPNALLKSPSYTQLFIRACKLYWHFLPVWSSVGIAVLSQSFRKKYWYKWLTKSIGSSGAAWIKWGQWSSTRNDMFPDALCDALATLHAAAPAHDWSFSCAAVEESLGLGPGTLFCVFDEFDPKPLASGSIAQIHKANLCGIPVAVKIRHPNVQQLIDMDFRLMRFTASILDKIPAFAWLHIKESVDQFSHTMAAQAYLQVEAHHLEVLNYNFRKWRKVKFPTPFFASSAVIIETFEKGTIASDLIEKYESLADALNSNNDNNINNSRTSNRIQVIENDDDDDDDDNEIQDDNNSEVVSPPPKVECHDLIPLDLAHFLVSTGVSIYLKMLLLDNLMHADLHPGNIMLDIKHHNKRRFRSKASDQEKALTLIGADDPKIEAMNAMNDVMDRMKITLVDAGMVARLTDDESRIFIGLVSCLGEGDGEEAAKFALQFSLENNMTDEEKQLFIYDMKTLFDERCKGYGTDVDVGHVLRGVLSLIRKHHVRIDANFATLVINILCIESIGRRVCPSYNVLDAAKPLLQGWRKLHITENEATKKHPKLFRVWMSLNAFKKEVGDTLFFLKQGKEKVQRNQKLAKQIQESLDIQS